MTSHSRHDDGCGDQRPALTNDSDDDGCGDQRPARTDDGYDDRRAPPTKDGDDTRQHAPPPSKYQPTGPTPIAPDDGLLRAPGSSRDVNSLALTSSGVRNLNINLLTAYRRTVALKAAIPLDTRAATIASVALAVIVVGSLAGMALTTWWCWAVAAYVVILGLVGLAIWVPFPRAGELVQWVKFTGTSNRWSLDLFRAFGLASTATKLVAGLVLLVPPALALVPCVLVDGPVGELLALFVLVITFAIGLLAYVAWLDRLARGLGADRKRGLPGEINRLTMVHALSWTALPEFPGESRKRHRPLLFVSSFNEAFDGYVGGFVEGLGEGLSIPWGQSPNFPNVKDGFRPFLEYVERTSNTIHHSFSAYPHLTSDDVRSALHVDRTVRSFALQNPPARRSSRWPQFLTEVQHGLVSMPLPAGFGYDVANNRAEMGAARVRVVEADTAILVATVPFPLHHALEVQQRILAMPGGVPAHEGLDAALMSPFANVVGTHLARLSVVEDIHYEATVRRPVPPGGTQVTNQSQPEANAWIVLAAHLDVDRTLEDPLVDWSRRAWDQFEGTNTTDVWEFCQPRPTDRDGFARLVGEWTRRPITRAVDHPDATVWDVTRAVSGLGADFLTWAADPTGWQLVPPDPRDIAPPWRHP